MLMLLTVATFLYINNVRDIYATLVCSSVKKLNMQANQAQLSCCKVIL